MIGLFLITHGCYGESLIQNVCHVFNRRPPQLLQLGISAQDDPLDLLPLAQAQLSLVDSGRGVLVLTDLYGSSPSNLAAKLLKPDHIEGLAGVNLPMLLRAITYREKDMQTLLVKTTGGGRDGILNMLKAV